MIYFIIGLISGFVGVGFSTLRTISTIEGRFISAPILNMLASLNIFVLTYLVAEKNIPYMIANVLGSSISVGYLAYKRRKLNENHTNT